MPDLSHRPTRYAVSVLVAAGVLVGGLTTLDVRFGPDQALASEKEKASLLQKENQALRDRLSDTAAPPLAAGTSAEADETSSPNCARYATREDAQAAFLADPVVLASLDGDGDGAACEQLRSATDATSSSGAAVRSIGATTSAVFSREPAVPDQEDTPTVGPTKPDAPSKAEIVASGHHFGMATATTEEFDRLEFSLARQATMRGYYKGWDTPFDAARVQASWEAGEVPVMTWESRNLAFADDTTDYSLERIVDGEFDDYLTEYARDIKALGLPLVIRFDHEMNGNWYRWTEFENTYGNPEGSYIAAWRHVHDVFASVGANDDVVWMWSPNRVDNISRYPSIDNYWPGEQYVDWVGMTGYYRSGDKSPSFTATYDRTLGELRRVAPGKPIVLSEVGATETGGHKVDFMQDFFPGLEANPDIAGFIWFNYAISENGKTNDWRIDSTSGSFAAFSEGLAGSSFGLEVGKRFRLFPRTTSEPSTSTTTTSSTTSTSTTSTTTTTIPRSTIPSTIPSSTTTTTAPRPTSTTSTTTTIPNGGQHR